MKRSAAYFIVFSLLISFTVQSVFGDVVSLDPSFGALGRTFTSFAGETVYGVENLIERQADGKIVMACNVGASKICVARYNPDGLLDPSFGSGGKVVTDLPQGAYDNVRNLAIQPDGKILVVGWVRHYMPSETFSTGFVLRYNLDGTLDLNFSGAGVRFIYGLGDSQLGAVAIQPDGKIVVAGESTAYGVTVLRFSSAGTLDPSFSNDGIAGTPISYRAHSIALQSNGKITIAGDGYNDKWCVIRHNSDGSADTSFDGDGLVLTAWVTQSNTEARAMVIQPDGKILVAGTVKPDTTFNIALARYNTDGSLDNTFDSDGRVIRHVSAGDRSDFGQDVLLQQNGKILVLANVNAPPNSTSEELLGLLRLNTDGSPDTTFDGDGVKTLQVAGTADRASSMALQPNEKLLVAGTANTNAESASFYVLRLNLKAQAPFDFDFDGMTDISIYRPSNGQWWISKSSGGVFAAPFGGANDKIAPGDFTGDGKTDLAFFRPSTGEWFIFRSENNSFYSFPFGLDGDMLTVADYDGDSIDDVSIFRPSNSRWYVMRSSGDTEYQLFGQNGDVPVPADYDGNGRAERAYYRPSTGQWTIRRSIASEYVIQFGNSSDKPVPGDYTGDGKADVAFFRPSTSEWFILRSENQSYYKFTFGASGDVPAPGDYDGDGKFDAAIFRPSNGRWYVQRSTAGALIQTFGQNGDRPVPNAFVP